MLRFWSFLAGFWFVLNFRLRNAEESLHRVRELLKRRFTFCRFRLHDPILARRRAAVVPHSLVRYGRQLHTARTRLRLREDAC